MLHVTTRDVCGGGELGQLGKEVTVSTARWPAGLHF